LDAGSGITLTINVVGFSGSNSRAWSLASVRTVLDSVSVQAPTVGGTISTTTGPSPLVLSNVSTGANAWVSASPATTASIYLPSLVSVANRDGTTLDIPLLLRDEFSFVSGLFTQTTLSLDSTKAQLALKIEDAAGNGVKNARISNPGGVTVAYANFGAWIDTSLDPFTDESGRVAVINLPAPAAPGAFVTVTAYGDNGSGTQVKATGTLPIEAGFVSYGTILLDLS
jgi:hypothetical protein